MDYWILLASFLIGSFGALVIVWLRWIGTLPRFSSSVEIDLCEEEYKQISGNISKKLKENKEISQPEVTHSNDLRDDIWRQRMKSFTTSAILYTVLGGVTAVLFVGWDLQNITDSANIAKLIAAGALWTTFYSFLDVKKTVETIDNKKESIDASKDKSNLELVEGLKTQLTDQKKKVIEYAKKYNEVVDAYKKLIDEKGGS
jgi:hypothetical protein